MPGRVQLDLVLILREPQTEHFMCSFTLGTGVTGGSRIKVLSRLPPAWAYILVHEQQPTGQTTWPTRLRYGHPRIASLESMLVTPEQRCQAGVYMTTDRM